MNELFMNTFSIIFKRNGLVSDDYILHSDCLDSKFVPFSDVHPLDVVHDSDVESGYDNEVLDDGPDVNDDEEVDLEE